MGEGILNSLEAAYLDDIYVEEERIAVVLFSLNYRCSDCRCSFEVEHMADSTKVVDMYEANCPNQLHDTLLVVHLVCRNQEFWWSAPDRDYIRYIAYYYWRTLASKCTSSTVQHILKNGKFCW